MTNAVADIEQETPEIGKERQLAGVGTGAGAGTNNNKKPHDHALASILGPAFVAAVAYVDPGNVAANITSGARYGYLLVWVLVLANAMSVLIQYQSAKLGIVTNKSLPELLGERMSDAGRFMFFMQAEVIAIATDLAEVIGGAIALNLLFGLPLFIGGLVIGTISTVMLWFQGGKTQTTFERIIIVMLLVITFGFIAGLFVAPPNPGEVVKGMIPRLPVSVYGTGGSCLARSFSWQCGIHEFVKVSFNSPSCLCFQLQGFSSAATYALGRALPAARSCALLRRSFAQST